MSFVLGVDGGATKTLAAIGDDTGLVLGTALAGPSNYQVLGLDIAMKNLSSAVDAALHRAGVDRDSLAYGVFALAGADTSTDFENLRLGAKILYPALDFDIVNDTLAGFRAGTSDTFGGVAIAGTGANFAAWAPDGKKVFGRGMGYEWGGADDAEGLIRNAMHHAFRSHDGTGPKTGLEKVLLSVLQFASYDDLSDYLRSSMGRLFQNNERAAALVPRIFRLASEGDEVCAGILVKTGGAMGEIMGRMIKTLGSWQRPQDIVMTGSLFTKGENPLLVDSFAIACHSFVPYARFKKPELEPAGGAYLLALEQVGVEIGGKVRARALSTFPRAAAENIG